MRAATFSAPGPGSWQLDAVHFPRPVTRLFSEVFPTGFNAGFREGARLYGALLDTLEFGTANGFMYFAPRPVGAPKNAKGTPPKAIFKLLLALHPELRRRGASARQTFATKRWRDDLRLWDEQRKPASVRAHLELQAVDPAALDDAALLTYLEQCLEHWKKMIEQHHRFDCAALLAVGDFLVHAAEWSGLEPPRLCALLGGASDVSSGASPELERLRAALAADPAAQSVLDSTVSPRDTIARLRDAGGEVGAAARAWLALVSHRLQNGLDVCELTTGETHEFIVMAIRSALEGMAGRKQKNGGPDVAAVRDRVPAEHRSGFDELLAEARLMYRVRDERGLYSDIWAAGIMRRALLEAGRRLTAKGRLASPELLLDAGWDEIRVLLSGGTEPSNAVLEERARYRSTMSPHEVPATLGPESSGPPPTAWMPADTARLEQALGMGIIGIFADAAARSEARVVRGISGSGGKAEGTARVVHDVNGFDKLQHGDILVTRATTAAFNIVLPMLAGIVTDRGGTLSHSAIVAREYGIPAVVGSRDATRTIPDGARIRIDGDLGEALVL